MDKSITGVTFTRQMAGPYVNDVKRRNSFAFAVIALLCLSTTIQAKVVHPGGDGNFCTARGYLAFDYNQSEVRGGRLIKNLHLLKIVRFGPGHRIFFAGWVNLPKEFKVLWMDCNAERIEIAGPIWPRGIDEPWTRCEVRIGATTDIGSAECVDNVVYKKPVAETSRLEVMIQSEDVKDPPPITLEAGDDTSDVYQLRRHLTEKHIPGRGAESKTEAEVVALDQKGKTWQRLVIYEYAVFEAAD
ncbi:MAG: hypothetical protein WA609_11855 [Terriglobales bacterium]